MEKNVSRSFRQLLAVVFLRPDFHSAVCFFSFCSFSHWLYLMLLRISQTVLVFSPEHVATGTTTTNYFVPQWRCQYSCALRIAIASHTGSVISAERKLSYQFRLLFSILCLHFKSICIFSFCCARDSDERIAVDICLFAGKWWCACAAWWHVFELNDSFFQLRCHGKLGHIHQCRILMLCE